MSRMFSVRAVAVTCMLFVPTATIADDLIRFALSLDAHRCCAATEGSCAQLSTPDECCQTQDLAASQGFTTIGPESRTRPASIQVAIAAPIDSMFSASIAISALDNFGRNTFKRPHDPPHLHPFPLLI